MLTIGAAETWRLPASLLETALNHNALRLSTAEMRLPSAGVRGRRAAEPSDHKSEEDVEPVHYEHPHTEAHEHSHSEHHPSHHDYNSMKEKFMNELDHLPSKTLQTFQRLTALLCNILIFFSARKRNFSGISAPLFFINAGEESAENC